MRRHYIKTCLLCERTIPSKHKLCIEHFRRYQHQMNEPWFIALLTEQKKQDEIGYKEQYGLSYKHTTDLHGTITVEDLISKRNVGRPLTDWRIVNKVLDIYDTSVEEVLLNKSPRIISLRAIARQVNQVIDHCTVRNIIKVYR